MQSDVKTGISRRKLVTSAIAAGAGLAASKVVVAADVAPVKPFRVAHLTDMHVQPERRAIEGYTAALASLEKLDPKPDLLITGGDHVMDSTEQFADRTKVVWDAFHKSHANAKYPWRSVIGNHDVFAWA